MMLALLLAPAAYSSRSLPEHGDLPHQQRHLLQANSTAKLSVNPSKPPSPSDQFALLAAKLAYLSNPSFVS